MSRRNLTVSDFDAVYKEAKELTPGVLKALPSDLVDVFGSDKMMFFSQLKEYQPLTFRALNEQCGPVILLESLVMMQSLCRIALESGDRLIFANVYNPNSVTFEQRESLQFLPTELHGYYQFINGFNDPINTMPGPRSIDLPCGLSMWQPLDHYRQAHRLAPKRLKKFKKELGHINFRIFIESRESDIILVDFASDSKKIYHVKDLDFDNYHLLEKPAETIDRYCAHKIVSAMGDFDFRD
jgi:hypothetical protein